MPRTRPRTRPFTYTGFWSSETPERPGRDSGLGDAFQGSENVGEDGCVEPGREEHGLPGLADQGRRSWATRKTTNAARSSFGAQPHHGA